jgi:hypothetical protein
MAAGCSSSPAVPSCGCNGASSMAFAGGASAISPPAFQLITP